MTRLNVIVGLDIVASCQIGWHSCKLISTSHPSNFVSAGDVVVYFQSRAGCQKRCVLYVAFARKSAKGGDELGSAFEGPEIENGGMV